MIIVPQVRLLHYARVQRTRAGLYAACTALGHIFHEPYFEYIAGASSKFLKSIAKSSKPEVVKVLTLRLKGIMNVLLCGLKDITTGFNVCGRLCHILLHLLLRWV